MKHPSEPPLKTDHEQLSEQEAAELASCEAIIDHGLVTFCEVGSALLKIRDERLYRATHRAFEEYCRERWQMSRFYAHRIMEAARVAENLLPIGNKPRHESQIRSLAGFEPEEQRAIWKQAVTEANGQPTAAHVGEVSKAFKQLTEEKIAAPENAGPPEPAQKTGESLSRRELAEIREQMRKNGEHVNRVMNFIRAIETFSNPSLPIREIAQEILEMDTPDKNWRGQARDAAFHLNRLVKELKVDETCAITEARRRD
jgi:hypothetical protein